MDGEEGGLVSSGGTIEYENANKPRSYLEYPQRPGEPGCKYYMRTGMCRYG